MLAKFVAVFCACSLANVCSKVHKGEDSLKVFFASCLVIFPALLKLLHVYTVGPAGMSCKRCSLIRVKMGAGSDAVTPFGRWDHSHFRVSFAGAKTVFAATDWLK